MPSDKLCEAVRALWEGFTRERSGRDAAYLEQAWPRRGYLAYYFPVNLAKVQALLEEVPEPLRDSTEAPDAFRVLDVGSGQGAAALGFLDWARRQPRLRRVPVQAVALDASSCALRDGERLWNAYVASTGDGGADLMTVRGDIERGGLSRTAVSSGAPYDLIVMANVLNELFRDTRDPIAAQTTLVRRLLDLLDPAGTMIIIEPALRETSRALHRVRDALLKGVSCTVHSPCLHESACPALGREEDWCHEERPWNAPALVAAIDRRIGLIKDSLKFSYLVLRKDSRSVVLRAPTVHRVVSELRVMKGERRAWLCNETGRQEVGRLDRERSEANAPVDAWHRGAIVRIAEIIRKTHPERVGTLGRIAKTCAVEVIRSVGPG
jgi:ribosomal protein RSM22 (predicted rRNA methylase)